MGKKIAINRRQRVVRSRVFRFLVTLRERALLEWASGKSGVTTSDFVRSLSLAAAHELARRTAGKEVDRVRG